MANKKKKYGKKVHRVRTSSQSSVEIQVTENEAIITQTTTTTITPSVSAPVITANSMLCPTPEFLQLLRGVGAEGTETAQGELFTFKMLGYYLKEYIKSQQLWDVYNPLQVHCGSDALGRVFGVNKFTLEDARLLLLKNAIVVDGGFRKRACVDVGNWTSPKKKCLSSPCEKESQASHNKTGPSASSTAGDVMVTHASLAARNPSSAGVASSSASSIKSPADVKTCNPSPSNMDPTSHAAASETKCEGKPIKPPVSETKPQQKPMRKSDSKPSSCPEDRAPSYEERGPRRRAPSISIVYSDGEGCPGSSPWLLQVQMDESDGTEVLSIMSKETTVVRSSDDDLWFLEATTFSDADHLDFDSDPPFDEEYEVETGSSSDAESVSSVEEILLVCGDSDMEFWADSESSEGEVDYSTDEELSQADKWFCGHCNTLNKAIRRYCDRCCRLRPGWLPGRISRRQKRTQASGPQRTLGHPREVRCQESSSSCVSDKEAQPPGSSAIPAPPLASEISSFSDSISSSSTSNQDLVKAGGNVTRSVGYTHKSTGRAGSSLAGNKAGIHGNRLPASHKRPKHSKHVGRQIGSTDHQRESDADTLPVQDVEYQKALDDNHPMEPEGVSRIAVSAKPPTSFALPYRCGQNDPVAQTPLHWLQSCPVENGSDDAKMKFSKNILLKHTSLPSKPEKLLQLSCQPENSFGKLEDVPPSLVAMDRFVSCDSGIGLSFSSFTSSQESLTSPVTVLTEQVSSANVLPVTPSPLGSPLQTRTCLANFQVTSSPPHTSLYYESKHEMMADGQAPSSPDRAKPCHTATTLSPRSSPHCSSANIFTRATETVYTKSAHTMNLNTNLCYSTLELRHDDSKLTAGFALKPDELLSGSRGTSSRLLTKSRSWESPPGVLGEPGCSTVPPQLHCLPLEKRGEENCSIAMDQAASMPPVLHSPQPVPSTSSGDSSSLCTICLSRAKDASLVHGKTGHQVSCYPCGKRLYRRKKPCPVCRQRIDFVIRNFIV